MEKWNRFRYLPVLPLGEEGRLVTGSKEHIRLSRAAAGEGMVLLKNENQALPLKKGSKVALFGRACVDYVKGGGGSGDTTVAYTMDFCEAMREKEQEGKVSVFEPLCEFYRENVRNQRAVMPKIIQGKTVEPEIPTELLEAAAAECDTAIISICRYSGENYDRTGEENDGDFYLSVEEQNMVEKVLSHFEHTVVVLNVGGVVDTNWFYEETKIPAVLLAWQGGIEGAGAQADILCGDVNPSGKLADTFAKSFDDYPSSYNFHESDDYVCYTEDVFVGYRYFETIPGAAERVNYPFGYGLSYTEFDIESKKVYEAEGAVHMELAVTNIGTVAGKEVVQIYSGAPQCRLEMPKLQLRSFYKTRLLAPGETEVFRLMFPVNAMASYDETMAAYVLFEGKYEIFAGSSIRSLEQIYEVDVPEEVLVEQLVNRCVPRKLPSRMRADGSMEELVMSEYDPVHNPEDWPRKINDRSAEYLLPNLYGALIPEEQLTLTKVADGTISLDEFIDSLSDEEVITLSGGTHNRGVADTNGIGGLDHREIPAVMTADGPAGLRIRPNRGVCTTAWPVGVLLACSWNTDLLYEIGKAGATEAKEMNFGMWLTPGINIHRNPLCGRNFEYYSEDPLLAGKLAVAKVKGIQSENISACAKHFCANNKETNRMASDSRISERALREIYLKPFEIVVKESGVWSVMTSYNKLNGIYTSENKELITGILREEWGYDGLVVTDWDNWAEPYRELLAGNNLRMAAGSLKRLQRAMEENWISREDIVSNIRRTLEFLLRLE